MLEFLLDPFNYLFWFFIAIIISGAIAIVWRPFNVYIQFAYINAKIEAIGNPFLTDKELNRLIEHKNIIELKDSINNYKDYDLIGDNSNEIHNSLDVTYNKMIEQSKNDCSKKLQDFFNVFFEKIDLNYIKIIIKKKLSNLKIENIESYKFNLQKTKKLMEEIINIDIEKLPEILIKYGFEDEIKNIFSSNNFDFILLDTIIDKFVLNKLKKVKIHSKCKKGLESFVNIMIDIKNIKNILRAKNFGYDENNCIKLFLGEGSEISFWKFKELSQNDNVIQIISGLEGTSYHNLLKDSIEEYNNNHSTQIFEKLLDEFYLEKIKEISIQNYVHIGPILRYIVSKEYEIMNLKIISKGIEEKISHDMLKNLIIKVKE